MAPSTCTILHLDMDAFYAAIEQRDRPELRGKPVIVGAAPDRRGVVATASYEARQYGVHSAMPSRTAFRLCPHGVFVPVRMDVYQSVSRDLMRILHDFAPAVEPISVDEAFLDVAGVIGPRGRYGSAIVLAEELRKRIRIDLRLTASVGVAPNKFLAKLASDMRKPDGLTVVPSDPADILSFLAPLPVHRIWGVGNVTAEQLRRRGIRTIGQLQAMSLQDVAAILGPTMGHHVWQLARGRDSRQVQSGKPVEKSISNEHTFPEDCTEPHVVEQTLLELTEKVGRRLRRAGKLAGVTQIKVRFSDFRTITRQRSLSRPTNSDRELLRTALAILHKTSITDAVRLIGFAVTDLTSNPDHEPGGQLLLFAPERSPDTIREEDLDEAVDQLRSTYGVDILKRGDWRR